MTSVSIGKKAFTNFLDSFGKGLEDIALHVDDDIMSASVGAMTHYIKRTLPVESEERGDLHISDLQKLRTFLKTNRDEALTLEQSTTTGMLTVTSGNARLLIQGTAYIKSQKETILIESLIVKSEQSGWTKWVDEKLSCSATVSTKELEPVTNMAKVVGDKMTCKMRFDAQDGEVVFNAGKAASGTMFVRVALVDAQGPNGGVESTFAHWLPDLLDSVPNGHCLMHTGPDTILVVRQEETGYLLLVMDQQFEED
tara:strand:+ start:199 stop:960 length:762 start_codon:yes stop_codon:yes gene_type:complete